MLRKFVMIAALAAGLAGCATGGGIPGPTDPRVVQIQQTAANICGFLPTVSTVASILATFTGGGAIVDIATQTAQGICAAITKKAARRGGPPASYRGVVIRGSRV